MASYTIGETVICSLEVKKDGSYYDPSTSMKIQINKQSPYSIVVSATDMTKDTTGKYHYDFQTSTMTGGNYQVIYTATDGTRITIEKDVLGLV